MDRPALDLLAMDLSRDVVSTEELRSVVAQRHEFQLLDGICHFDPEHGLVVGYKDLDDEPWWARGHIPGRPLMPGVLLMEGGAQAATFLIKKTVGWPPDRFVGLGGVDQVRFRGQVVPPGRVHFVSWAGKVSGNRLARYPAEAWWEGKPIMEMQVLGILL